MKSIQEIKSFILDNKLYNTPANINKLLDLNVPYVLNQVPKDEEVIFAFASDTIKSGSHIVTIGDSVVFITEKHLVYGKAKSGFLSQAGLKVVDLSQVNDFSFEPKLWGSFSDQAELRVDTIREEVVIQLGPSKSGNEFGNLLISKLNPLLIEIKEKLNQKQTTIQQTFSVADEIKKFKELLDMGVITQEEFDTKKSELLGKK